nr:Chain A, CATESTATIN [synthetic construct]
CFRARGYGFRGPGLC